MEKRYKNLRLGDVFYEFDKRVPEQGIKKLLFVSLTKLEDTKVEIKYMEEENGPIKSFIITNYNDNGYVSSNNIFIYSPDIDVITERAEPIIEERIKEIQDKIKEHEGEIKNLNDKIRALDRLLLIKKYS